MEDSTLAACLIGTVCALGAASAQAGPADKVYAPGVEAGEFEIELRGGYHDDNDAADDDEQQYILDFGYGVNRYWFTELALEYEKLPGASGELEAIEWENIFQLTEPGQYWLDVGFFFEYEYALEGGPDEIVFGPLLQKDFGRLQANFNPLIERQIGSGAEDEFEWGYAMQLKWRRNPLFEPGLQGFGKESAHRLGPAVFGAWRPGGHKFKYDAAVLFGLSDAAADITLRFQFEYEI